MKSVAMTFGRMNPFTKGHLQVVKTLHEQNTDKKYVYLSHTQDKPKKKNPLACKNPLPYETKVMYAKYFLAESPYNDVEIKVSEEKQILGCIIELYKEGFREITVVVGADRVEDFENLVNKYNNWVNPNTNEIDYSFEKINVVSAGDRDPDADGIEAMSASKVREAAYLGNFEEFKEGIPTENEDVIKDLYNDVRLYMGVI